MPRTVLTAIDVSADADATYRAIATESGQRAFWTTDCDLAETEGGRARFGFEKAPVDLEATVATLEPGTLVAWDDVKPWPYWTGTTIRWELSPSDWVEGGTLVLLRHDGWPDDTPDAEIGRVTETWSAILGRLKGYLETGDAQPYFG